MAGDGFGFVTSTPRGISGPSACSGVLASDSAVTLTASAGVGSTFAGWGGDCRRLRRQRAVCLHRGGGRSRDGDVRPGTSQPVNGWGCSNFAGRTVRVNTRAATATCGAGPLPLAKHADGYTYFTVTAGEYPWASLYVW